jgi:polar amino acid transport system substrate-binding protein
MLARLLFICLMLCGPSALACGPYTVALYDHGVLYSRQPDGKWGGLDKDVVDELARRTGCRFKLVVESRVRIWTMMASDALDITVSGVSTPEREVHSRFLPYLSTRYVVVLHDEVRAAIKSPEAFLADPDYKLGLVRGYVTPAGFASWAEQLRAQGRVYEASDFTAVAHLLQTGRVNAILVPVTSWKSLANTPGTGETRVADWAPNDNIVAGLVVSRKRVPAETADTFDKALRAMHADGTLEAIFRRYLKPELAASTAQF